MLILEGRLTWAPSSGPAGLMGDVCTEADVCLLRGGGAGEAAVYLFLTSRLCWRDGDHGRCGLV